MVITEAKCYATTISSDYNPQDDVFFENGQFNSSYIKNAIDFNNMYYTKQRYIINPTYLTFPTGVLDSGSVLDLVLSRNQEPITYINERYQLQDSKIYLHHQPTGSSPDPYYMDTRYFREYILFPVKNFDILFSQFNNVMRAKCRITTISNTAYVYAGFCAYRKSSSTTLSGSEISGGGNVKYNDPDWKIICTSKRDFPESVDYFGVYIHIQESPETYWVGDFEIEKIYAVPNM